MDFETGESSAKYTYPSTRKKTIKIKQNTKENTGNMIYNYIKLYFKVAKHFTSLGSMFEFLNGPWNYEVCVKFYSSICAGI